jgi:hypothetical protein
MIQDFSEVMQNQIFKLRKNPPEYTIGIDTYDSNCPAYCLFRKWDDHTVVLLAKTMHNISDFEDEVNNLAIYFNASIVYDEKEKKLRRVDGRPIKKSETE